MAEGDLQKAVGVYLRRYRLGKGLSQEAFADVVGVHRTYMGGLGTWRTQPHAQERRAYCRHLKG